MISFVTSRLNTFEINFTNKDATSEYDIKHTKYKTIISNVNNNQSIELMFDVQVLNFNNIEKIVLYTTLDVQFSDHIYKKYKFNIHGVEYHQSTERKLLSDGDISKHTLIVKHSLKDDNEYIYTRVLSDKLIFGGTCSEHITETQLINSGIKFTSENTVGTNKISICISHNIIIKIIDNELYAVQINIEPKQITFKN